MVPPTTVFRTGTWFFDTIRNSRMIAQNRSIAIERVFAETVDPKPFEGPEFRANEPELILEFRERGDLCPTRADTPQPQCLTQRLGKLTAKTCLGTRCNNRYAISGSLGGSLTAQLRTAAVRRRSVSSRRNSHGDRRFADLQRFCLAEMA